MNKMMIIASALVGVTIATGCSSSKANNPIAEWQEDRIFASEIATKNANATALTVTDVTYKSVLSEKMPAVAAPINAFAPVPAALYLTVVTGVDQIAAEQEGRLIYFGVQNDIKNGAKAEDIFAAMPAEDKAAYTAYANAIAQVNQEDTIKNVVTPMIATIAEEGAKVAVIVQQMRAMPEVAALVGLEAAMTAKDIAADGAALSAQISDATKGANLWLDLLQKDKEAKAFMAEYPVK